MRASWPAIEPTAPAAADTRTVSPARGRPCSKSPKYDVMPVMPSTPRYIDGVPSAGSTRTSPLPSDTAYSCTPKSPCTTVPTGNLGWWDSTTSPTAPARITSSMAIGGR